MADSEQKSWRARIFGGSILSGVFGQFFEIKNNTAGIIAVTLVLTLCYIVIYKADAITNIDKIVDNVLNIIFVVVGYYFGAKQTELSSNVDDK